MGKGVVALNGSLTSSSICGVFGQPGPLGGATGFCLEWALNLCSEGISSGKSPLVLWVELRFYKTLLPRTVEQLPVSSFCSALTSTHGVVAMRHHLGRFTAYILDPYI